MNADQIRVIRVHRRLYLHTSSAYTTDAWIVVLQASIPRMQAVV